MNKTLLLVLLLIGVCAVTAQKHTFTFSDRDFMLDGKPYQIISGEVHPSRIPAEYWQHRLKMVKALGCNTVSLYVFWNYHEGKQGVFDFTTYNRNIAQFIKLAQSEGLWVIVRPGPYVCAEWDFGGLPTYLLQYPNIKIRCMDDRYMQAATRYIKAFAKELKPLQITEGGNILMIQIENEYGSYGNDREYVKQLAQLWREQGITVPFFTGDGATPYMLEAGSLPNCAVGLDPGVNDNDFNLAEKLCPGVPVFGSEIYPGWLTHWGEKWAKPDTADFFKDIRYLMKNKRSFNLYVVHGGTNFGFTAGANSGGKGYEPDITSYDYDAPINEQGLPTAKYHALRKLIASYQPKGAKLPPIPQPIESMNIPPIEIKLFASIWDNLPTPINMAQPTTFEMLGQNQGLMLYKTVLIGHKWGNLTLTKLHDYATVFVDGKYIGTIDRRKGETSITLPETANPYPILEILVEGMGHINFASQMIDPKGITERATLNGMTLMNWQIYPLPLDLNFIKNIKPYISVAKPGSFFKGEFSLQHTADTYFDMSKYEKGIVWINGHNLGRFWNIGPQQRLYCPASWLKNGINEIIIFDQHQLQAASVEGFKEAE